MQQSDLNHAPSANSRFSRFQIIAIACAVAGFLMLAALAAYTVSLQRQIQTLRAENAPSTVEALFDLADTRPGRTDPHTTVMPGTPTDPFQHMEQIRQQMDAMMNSVFGGPSPAITGIPGFGSQSGSSLFGDAALASLGMNQLTLDLRETDHTLELVIPVQEGQSFEINTDVEEDRLTVSGTLSWQQQTTQNGINSERRGSSQFNRTIVLPGNVDPTGLVKEHRENEIVISLPKV